MHARVLALVVLLAGTLSHASGPPPGYVSEALPNGLRVSILPDPTMPVVATQVWYHVGSANEEPRTRGFAHLFEHMMFGGTASAPKRAVWDLHSRYGGDNNAYTSFDDTIYVSEIPPAGSARVLELEADRMVHLSLTPENLDNEKRIVTEELRLSSENSPFSRLYTKALKALLGEHPYALAPTGTKEDIAAATLEHAREFYERYYRPENAHVIVVGPVDATATLAKVRETFGAIPAGGETPGDVPSLETWKFPPQVDLKEDIPPVEVAAFGFPLPPGDHPDADTLKVLSSLLAGGNVDPVEEELVRRRHKALMAGVELMTMRRGGALFLYSASLPYRREASAYRFLEETRQKLAAFDWIDESKLAAAKRRLSLEELQGNYYASSIASRIGRASWYEGEERRAFDGSERIERVGVDDVKRAFERYVMQREPVRVYVSPEHVPVVVRLFGWLYPVVR